MSMSDLDVNSRFIIKPIPMAQNRWDVLNEVYQQQKCLAILSYDVGEADALICYDSDSGERIGFMKIGSERYLISNIGDAPFDRDLINSILHYEVSEEFMNSHDTMYLVNVTSMSTHVDEMIDEEMMRQCLP